MAYMAVETWYVFAADARPPHYIEYVVSRETSQRAAHATMRHYEPQARRKGLILYASSASGLGHDEIEIVRAGWPQDDYRVTPIYHPGLPAPEPGLAGLFTTRELAEMSKLRGFRRSNYRRCPSCGLWVDNRNYKRHVVACRRKAREK